MGQVVLFLGLILHGIGISVSWAAPSTISGDDLPHLGLSLNQCENEQFARLLYLRPMFLASKLCSDPKVSCITEDRKKVSCDASQTRFELVYDGDNLEFSKIECFPPILHGKDLTKASKEDRKNVKLHDKNVQEAMLMERVFQVEISDEMALALVDRTIKTLKTNSSLGKADCASLVKVPNEACQRLLAKFPSVVSASKTDLSKTRARRSQTVPALSYSKMYDDLNTMGQERLKLLGREVGNNARRLNAKAEQKQQEIEEAKRRAAELKKAEDERKAREAAEEKVRQAQYKQDKSDLERLSKRLEYFDKHNVPRKLPGLKVSVDEEGWVYTSIGFPHRVRFANADARIFYKHFVCNERIPTVSKPHACTNLTGVECVTLGFPPSEDTAQVNYKGYQDAKILAAFKNRSKEEVGHRYYCGSE